MSSFKTCPHGLTSACIGFFMRNSYLRFFKYSLIMKTAIKTLSLAFLLFCLCSFDLPKGWHAAGSKPKSYEMGMDKGAGREGNNCATIQSKDKKIKGFGTLMQTSSPVKYSGKRVKMTGWIKTENVNEWVGMWFRVDKENRSIAFDNMGTRPIKGTSEWKQYEIILDVAEEADMLAYGVLIGGTGKVWFDDIQFDIVDATTTTTDKMKLEPSNLKFEE